MTLDLFNKKFGKLIAIEKTLKRSDKKVIWKCRCECGQIVEVVGKHLKSGNTKSCGCLNKENPGRPPKHGEAWPKRSHLYNAWCSMKSRCYYLGDKDYYRYGGRGIMVCSEWKNDYLVFKKWALNNGYKLGLTLDRINNDGDYEPGNCQWLTKTENSKKARHENKEI